ncbi:hypothetical protein [Pseudomonas sp. TMB3-21]
MTKLLPQPRILRAFQAPSYLGMCREVFNKAVRPYVREFPIGKQGIGFDRLELDKWADAYIAAHSIHKQMNPESASLPVAAPQVGRNKPSMHMAGWPTGKAAYKPPASEVFYKLVDEILGRSGNKKNRQRKKLENQKLPTEG